MPIIKSAKKRVRVAKKATIRNAKTKRAMKSALKTFARTPSAQNLNAAMSEIDRAAKKNVIHKNKAARAKRQLAASAKSAKVKPAASAKQTASKPATEKKPVAKKSAPTKKPAAKKSPAKKPAPKKK